jgi:hypothetical protein
LTLPSVVVTQILSSYVGSLTRIRKRSKQLYAAMICLRQGRLFDSDGAIHQTRSIDSLIDLQIWRSVWPIPEMVDCSISPQCDCTFVAPSMKGCVHFTTCFVWKLYLIYIYIYIYRLTYEIKFSNKTYIYISVHTNQVLKQKQTWPTLSPSY